MPKFNFKAINKNGLHVRDELESIDQRSALLELEKRGLNVYFIGQVGLSFFTKDISSLKQKESFKLLDKKKIKSEEVLLCMQEMSTLLNAGIPLADSILNLSEGHAGRATGKILTYIYGGLRSGHSFATVLRDSQLNLPEYVFELIRAGEETGKLSAALNSVVDQMESDALFKRETRNALTYPVVLIASGILSTLVVFVFVVPKFANILTNPKADIPLFSRFVLESGLWLVNNVVLSFICVFSFLLLLWSIFSNKEIRLKIWDWAGNFPITKKWITNVELARWGSMFSVLLQNHVPLLDALDHSKNSLTSVSWKTKAEIVAKDVKSGQTLFLSMENNNFLDAIGLNLIRVGEKSGKLAETTSSLANMHKVNAQQSMKKFLVLLEPLTILLISTILGGIMISVMVAITSLTNVI